MKTISTNPDLFEIVHNWAAANPTEFFFGMTAVLMVICYRFRDSF